MPPKRKLQADEDLKADAVSLRRSSRRKSNSLPSDPSIYASQQLVKPAGPSTSKKSHKHSQKRGGPLLGGVRKKSNNVQKSSASGNPPASGGWKVDPKPSNAQSPAGHAGKKLVRPADSACPHPGCILEDYEVMLNQTNIWKNNNKFYGLQVVSSGCNYYVFTKWGRVGEPARTQCSGPLTRETAVSKFKSQFRSKTSNSWDSRSDFIPHAGKYEIIAIDHAEIEEECAYEIYNPCSLDPETQSLVEFIFNDGMFKDAMSNMDLDVEKMPLGKLTPEQIQRGVDILEEIQAAVQSGASIQDLTVLSSKFFQVIPHCFGRRPPPVISTIDMVKEKLEHISVLSDIEVAQKILNNDPDASIPKQVHPADVNYEKLKTDLEIVASTSDIYCKIQQYLNVTKGRNVSLQSLWSVNRHGEAAKYNVHNHFSNRKLLWHGTNVAVVAAILKNGLRIMPHSGGRVGKGIYLASENAKSACYVRPGNMKGTKIGIMFLVEAALGEEYHIIADDHTLKSPPPGYDSVVAQGKTEPNPDMNAITTLDGNSVTIPQGKPVQRDAYRSSSFHQSEYLIYKESQQRIRFMMTLKY